GMGVSGGQPGPANWAGLPASEPNTEAFPATLFKANEHMTELIHNNNLLLCASLLKQIGDDYQDRGVTFEELKHRYLIPFQNASIQSMFDAEAPDDESIDPNKCLARTGGNKQCSRKKQRGWDYCGIHLHHQPQGRIDGPDPTLTDDDDPNIV